MALNYGESYRNFVKSLLSRESPAEASMSDAVGGSFDQLGQLMVKILIQAGLKPKDYLIDVGCGSGRLTKPIAQYLTKRYLGTDVVPELLENAKTLGKKIGVSSRYRKLQFLRWKNAPIWFAFFRC